MISCLLGENAYHFLRNKLVVISLYSLQGEDHSLFPSASTVMVHEFYICLIVHINRRVLFNFSWVGSFIHFRQCLYLRTGSLRILIGILFNSFFFFFLLTTAFFRTEISEVVPGICWSYFPCLAVLAKRRHGSSRQRTDTFPTLPRH